MALFAKLKLYAALLGFAVIGILGSYWLGGRDGVARRKQRETLKRLKDMKKAREIEDEVASLDDDALRKRANKWVRRNTD